jgi:hypothetical protein
MCLGTLKLGIKKFRVLFSYELDENTEIKHMYFAIII